MKKYGVMGCALVFVLSLFAGCSGEEAGQTKDQYLASSNKKMLIPRTGQSAVWTGSKMLVYGGYNSTYGYVPDVISYDPSSDTWSIIKPLNQTLYDHTATWTGTEMVVWGGLDNGNETNKGSRYNPSSNIWSAMSTTPNAPIGGSGYKSVWTGNQIFVWRGSNYPYTTGLDGGLYNPTTDIWTTVSGTNCPPARGDTSALWDGSEVLVWGGTGMDNVFTPIAENTGGRYNPATNIWSAMSTTNSPSARFSHCAVWTGSEMLVFGGRDYNPSVLMTDGGRYNPSTDTWTTMASYPIDASWGGEWQCVWSGTEMIAMTVRSNNNWSGFDYPIASEHLAGRYNPLTNNWQTFTIKENTYRWKASTVWTGSEMIIWGGGSTGNYYDEQLYTGGIRYNPSTSTWKWMSIFSQ